MPDLSSLLSAVVALAHSAKLNALAVLAFYILGDAVISMILNRKWFSWSYATGYIYKFKDIYLGLAVMAVMGQYVAAVDALFWISVALYTKNELTALMGKFGWFVPAAPVDRTGFMAPADSPTTVA